MKRLFFDLETTGVKYWENGIHQISGMIEIDSKIVETFNFKVRPFPECVIEPEALALNNLTVDIIAQYPGPNTIYRQLVTLLSKYVDKYNKSDKFFLAGYNNASFDNQFLREFFTRNGDKYFGSWFWSNSIDVMVLASEALINERSQMINFKLHTVAKQFGITVDDEMLHDALYDIKLTKNIYDCIYLESEKINN